MKIATSLVFSLQLILSFQVSAESPSEYDVMYDKCVTKYDHINNGVVAECSEEVSAKAKHEITRRYKSIYAKLLAESPEDARKFESSQKSWLQYRNLHCDLAGSYIGSPMYGFCPMNLNAARALELRELDGD